jgi:hypothetical protein
MAHTKCCVCVCEHNLQTHRIFRHTPRDTHNDYSILFRGLAAHISYIKHKRRHRLQTATHSRHQQTQVVEIAHAQKRNVS